MLKLRRQLMQPHLSIAPDPFTKERETMSCIRLNLIDFSQTVSGEVHGSIGDAVIAALGAEPETIHELELALARFSKPSEGWSSFAGLYGGENFEPYDAGIVIVDLAARIVMLDSTYSAPMPISNRSDEDIAEQIDSHDELESFMANNNALANVSERAETYLRDSSPTTYGLRYHNGEHLTDLVLPYRLPADWLFLSSVPEYEGACSKRRAERQRIKWHDPRDVLFGKPLTSFLATAIISAGNLDNQDLFTEIHIKWLVTNRDDLGGRSPREVLLASKEFIDFDLHSRQLQWSFVGECPPPLLPNSHAYRFAGFGTHEIVIYYELIRLLLAECSKRVSEETRISVEDEATRLDQIKNVWLETPSHDYQGKAPGLVIEWERRRIPLAISGKEAMVDEDCPVCQAMAEDLEPYFWHLDGSGMDDCFEFSFYETREEWEAERRSWEEFSRKFNRQRAEQARP
jgi:hypothetical protein